MKYPKKSAIGHAGEYFFAYKIASVLEWPCRLIDIDIGIDAQVEIINEDRTSTGNFVAFQVKTSSLDEVNCRYVSKMQLDYWRELGLPVFVVLVNLKKKEMYLHQVSIDHEYHITEAESIRIDFDPKKDKFCKKSAAKIAFAASETALKHIQSYLNEVIPEINTINDEIENLKNDCPSARALIELVDQRFYFKEKIAQAEALVAASGVGKDEFNDISTDYETALESLRDIMNSNFRADHDDDGRLKIFVQETR